MDKKVQLLVFIWNKNQSLREDFVVGEQKLAIKCIRYQLAVLC